jgi:hypothetical protein
MVAHLQAHEAAVATIGVRWWIECATLVGRGPDVLRTLLISVRGGSLIGRRVGWDVRGVGREDMTSVPGVRRAGRLRLARPPARVAPV